jgi:HlyD family secretion protein
MKNPAHFSAEPAAAAPITQSTASINGGQQDSEPPPVHENKKQRARLRIAIAASVVVIAIAIVGVGTVVSKKDTAPAQNPHKPVLTVTTQAPQMLALDRRIAINGTISAWDPVSVAATTGGLQVDSVRVEEGDLVKAGQILATLDSSQLKAQLDSELARLAANEANAKKSVQPLRREDINGLEAAVAQAQATVADQGAALVQAKANRENADTNITRYEYLKTEGAVSAQEAQDRATVKEVDDATVDSAEQRVRAAKFALKQAQEKLAMAHEGGRQEDIDIARAAVGESKGNVRKLRTQIDETIIRAPVDGLIARRDVHLGDIAQSGKMMFLIARDNRLEVKAQVPETDLRYIQAGQPVNIQCSVTGDKKIAGRVREISPLVDADTRLGTVRVDVPIACGLKAGMYAEGKTDIGKYAALTVPEGAVITRDDKSTVFVLHNNNQVESRAVTVGSRDAGHAEITNGLTGTDAIVVDGAGFLKDGDYVQVGQVGK